MTEHLSNADLARYARGVATPSEMLALDDHLALCDACRTRAAATAQATTQLSSLKADYSSIAAAAPDHLTHEELAALVEGTLDEVEEDVLRAHLVICTECTREESGLREFKNSVGFNLHKQYAPGAAPTTEASRWRLRSLWRAYKDWSPAWQTALAAALLLIAGTAVWLIWNAQRQASRQPHLARTDNVDNPPSPDVNGGSVPTPTAMPAQTADAVIALADGGDRVLLDQQGQLSGLEYLSSSSQTAIKTALQQQRAVNAAALAGLAGQDGALMSGQAASGEFDVLGPRGEVVESDRPVFRWRLLEGADGYTVKVFDQNFNVVAQSQALNATTWRPMQPLARGAVYSWQVTAVKEGQEVKAPRPPAPQAKLKVLDAGTAAELRTAREQQPVSHLALGVLYARAGMLEQAERELNALLRANPESEVARKLQADVRAARRTR